MHLLFHMMQPVQICHGDRHEYFW